MHRIYMLVVEDRYLTSKEMHNGSHDDRLWKKMKVGRYGKRRLGMKTCFSGMVIRKDLFEGNF